MEWIEIKEEDEIVSDSKGDLYGSVWLAIEHGSSYGRCFNKEVFSGFWDECEGYKTQNAVGNITHVARLDIPDYPKA